MTWSLIKSTNELSLDQVILLIKQYFKKKEIEFSSHIKISDEKDDFVWWFLKKKILAATNTQFQFLV